MVPRDWPAMPIERRSSTAQVRAVLIAVVALVFTVTLGYAIVRAATGTSAPTTSGTNDGRWNAGEARTKAAAIAEDGPILLPDPAGPQRLPIYLSHTGGDHRRNWFAFEARPPGADDGCFLTWDAARERFTAPCTDDTYPLDGDGLRSFPTRVTRDGDLVVDLTPARSEPDPNQPDPNQPDS